MQLPLSIQARMKIEKQFFPDGVTADEIKLISKIEELVDAAFEAGKQGEANTSSQVWSNQAAFGYTIMSAERIGMKPEEIQKLVRAMHNRFDAKTLEEAREHYCGSSY